MDLREYLFRKRMTIKALAEEMDCSKPQLSLVKRGKPVSPRFARRLEKATNGEIQASDIVTIQPKERIA